MSIFDFWKPAWEKYPSPPVTPCDSEDDAQAQAFAAVTGNQFVNKVAFTGSMLPTLQGGDMVLLDPVDFATLQAGDIITYKAEWNPTFSNVCHRILLKDDAGWVASGDNNPHSEASWRVTPDNYHAKCVAVFRFPQPQPIVPST